MSSIIFKDSAMTSTICVLFCLVLLSFVSVFPLRLPVNSSVYYSRQSFATRCFAASEFIKSRGLLTEIVDVSNVKDYSREINLDDAVNLLRDRNYINNIALAEAHGNATELKNNLTKIIEKAKIFMANRDEVWDREELKGALLQTIEDIGNFICLLGGKSTGKTLVIKFLEKRILEESGMDSLIFVDLREEGDDILKALLEVLKRRRNYYKMKMSKGAKFPRFWRFLQFWRAVGSGAAAIYVSKEKEYAALVDIVTLMIEKKTVDQPLSELLGRMKGKITIVIDEANLAFDVTPETKQEKIAAMKLALALLTSLTKVNGKV